MIAAPQLRAILAHAMPGATLVEAHPLGERTLLLNLERRRVVLRLGGPDDAGAGEPLAAEAAALAALRGEIDLSLPELLAADDGAGVACLVCSYLDGAPLPTVLAELDEERRYAIGRELGALLFRVHAYGAAHYGALDPKQPAALRREPVGPSRSGEPATSEQDDEDVRYLAARVDSAIAAALEEGELQPAAAKRLHAWLSGNLAGSGQPACLVHGDLRPERVLLRRRDRSWQLGGLVGWGYAQGWRPAWDHVAVMEQFAGSEYFGMRVGYGNAYDERTERPADQLREFAMLPFRLVLYLESGRADLALAMIGEEEMP